MDEKQLQEIEKCGDELIAILLIILISVFAIGGMVAIIYSLINCPFLP